MLHTLRSYGVYVLIAVVIVVILLPWLTAVRQYTGGGNIDLNDNHEVVEAALERFVPELRPYLSSIPIVYGEANTARALTTVYVPSGFEYIAVSPDWDKTWGESKYWESVYSQRGYTGDAPAFPNSFKLNLLVHEYLHYLEPKLGLDVGEFYEVVADWYHDPSWGSFESNQAKHTLYWNVYGGNGKKWGLLDDKPHPGQEEFAYIGERIANGSKECWSELSLAILEYYEGILIKGGMK